MREALQPLLPPPVPVLMRPSTAPDAPASLPPGVLFRVPGRMRHTMSMMNSRAVAATNYSKPTIAGGLGQAHPSSRCMSTSHEEKLLYRAAPTHPAARPVARSSTAPAYPPRVKRRPAPALPIEHGSHAPGLRASQSVGTIAPHLPRTWDSPPHHAESDDTGIESANTPCDHRVITQARGGARTQPNLRPGDDFRPPGSGMDAVESQEPTWHGRQRLPIHVIVAPAPPWRVENAQRVVGF